jgi:hypothetical protein
MRFLAGHGQYDSSNEPRGELWPVDVERDRLKATGVLMAAIKHMVETREVRWREEE